VTSAGATLNGRINPQGVPTTWWFENGPTTAYGSETPRRDAGSGNAEVPVSARVPGLAARTTYVDFGQTGNPCGAPPGDPGTALAPPAAEGGALRSQDLRSTGTGWGSTGRSSASIRRPAREGTARQSRRGRADRNVRRIVAHGLRNPFRITVRPGTGEAWIGDRRPAAGCRPRR
jgi:hypothetical protein